MATPQMSGLGEKRTARRESTKNRRHFRFWPNADVDPSHIRRQLKERNTASLLRNLNVIRLVAMVLGGLLAAFVASNVTTFFVARPDFASRVLIGPVIEEGARVAALALLFSRFDIGRFQRLGVLGFAVGFSIVGLIWHVAFNLGLSPPLPPVVTYLAPVGTVAFHVANSAVAAQYIERRRYMTALLVCLAVHALYNGYIVLAFANLGSLAQSIEVPLRTVLLLVVAYLFLRPPLKTPTNDR